MSDQTAAVEAMREEGIETQVASYGLHRLSAYRDAPIFSVGGGAGLPVAEQLHQRGLALPLHLGLSDRDIDRVCESLLSALAAQGGGRAA